MDDIEQRISDDLETEISNELTKHEAGVLEEEIRIENESRRIQSDNIKNFEKSQKPKKSLKNKIIAWVLGASIFAGAVAGGIGIYNNNFSEEAKYNKEIKTKFEQVDETLTNRLNRNTDYGHFDSNKKIEYFRFNDEAGEDKILEVFYEGSQFNQGTQKSFDYEGSATYKVLEAYYTSLVEAEESNNMITYLDALNQIFETMEYQSSEFHDKYVFTDEEKTEETVAKINELIALDFAAGDNIVKQVGFLPFNIEITKWDVDDENKVVSYTFKIHGISYCETNSQNSSQISTSKDLLMGDYNKNHIKTFYRDIEISSSRGFPFAVPEKSARLKGDIWLLINNEKSLSDFDVKTTYFQETNIFENYNEMQEGNFNFAVPETFEK